MWDEKGTSGEDGFILPVYLRGRQFTGIHLPAVFYPESHFR